MTHVELHGARIPLLGLGTWQLADRTCMRIVEQALRLGYRHLDTAQAYENEVEVGEGLRRSGVPRNDVFITTKVWQQNLAPRDLIRTAKESLTRLKLNEVDLLLIHWPSESVPLADTLGALAQVREAGMTRHIGISNFTVALMEQAVQLCPAPIVCNQIEYHPLLDQSKLLAACARLEIAPVAYCPLVRGGLGEVGPVADIAARHGKSPAQVALRWLVQRGIVAIPRTSRVERLSENMAIFDFELSKEEMATIGALGSRAGRIVSPAFAPQWD